MQNLRYVGKNLFVEKLSIKNILKKNISNFKFSLDYSTDLKLIKEILKQIKSLKIHGTSDEIVSLIKKNNHLLKISNENRLKYLKNKKFKRVSF